MEKEKFGKSDRSTLSRVFHGKISLLNGKERLWFERVDLSRAFLVDVEDHVRWWLVF